MNKKKAILVALFWPAAVTSSVFALMLLGALALNWIRGQVLVVDWSLILAQAVAVGAVLYVVWFAWVLQNWTKFRD